MESKVDYTTETQEALDMLGKGYEDQPAVVVEPPRRRIERRGKQMMEVEEAAYVKFSTEFKAELADLDVYALKVFIYIGLSINFETGTAFPGVRKIAKETKMNKDTVAKAIEELEEKGFLRVRRKDGSSNVYKPECYFAIGETVPSGRTVPKPSEIGAELSDENTELSDASRVKSAQPDKQDLNKIKEGATKPAAPRANDFPSNVLYREVTERYPSKANWHDVLKFIDGVSQRLGRAPTKEDLAPFYSAWCGMGWNNNSINWLEYAVKGVMPGKQNGKGYAPAQTVSEGFSVIDQVLGGM
jgi:hypothetical protein